MVHSSIDDAVFELGSAIGSALVAPVGAYIHRILDAKQSVKTLAISGQGRLDDSTASVLEATGFFVDVSDVGRATYQAEVSKALGEILESRSVIEQAKGILMLTYGLDDEDAFALLRHHSSLANVKIRVLADGLLELARSGAISSQGTRAVDAFFARAPARR